MQLLYVCACTCHVTVIRCIWHQWLTVLSVVAVFCAEQERLFLLLGDQLNDVLVAAFQPQEQESGLGLFATAGIKQHMKHRC
jgi:hypothetical protein